LQRRENGKQRNKGAKFRGNTPDKTKKLPKQPPKAEGHESQNNMKIALLTSNIGL